MPSDNEYLTYILELLREVDGITFKKMMGEFILYKNGTIFGGVYDNRFLVKKSKSLESSSLKEQIPYPTKTMERSTIRTHFDGYIYNFIPSTCKY